MKKVLMLLTILLWPINAFAYSEYVIPGGKTLGIEVDTKGIMVIGFYKVNNKFNKGTPELKNGDYIIEVNGNKVSNISEMTKVIENNLNNDYLDVTFTRNKKIYQTKLDVVLNDGIYKTGLYVKSSITGIGTLSYIDPETKIYGALGHEIIENVTSSKVEIKSGLIFKSMINGIEKSLVGKPGSKLSKFDYSNNYGSIVKNTRNGIFGIYSSPLPDDVLIKVSDDINIGKAYFKTVINNEEVENFLIEITAINEKSDIKNISFKIIDERLLNLSGGVIQGMSGSPIIQNDNIVGVLTHVVVDNPVNGYGILIRKMLEEGDKLK